MRGNTEPASSGPKNMSVTPPRKPAALDESEAHLFASLYLQHKCNGAAAMRELRPHLTDAAARQQAHRFMQRTAVQAAIEAIRSEISQATILTITQAEELLSSIARGERPPGTVWPPTASERVAAIRQLTIIKGWGQKKEEAKPVNETGTLLARIRMARGAAPVQEATIISETQTLKQP